MPLHGRKINQDEIMKLIEAVKKPLENKNKIEKQNKSMLASNEIMGMINLLLGQKKQKDALKNRNKGISTELEEVQVRTRTSKRANHTRSGSVQKKAKKEMKAGSANITVDGADKQRKLLFKKHPISSNASIDLFVEGRKLIISSKVIEVYSVKLRREEREERGYDELYERLSSINESSHDLRLTNTNGTTSALSTPWRQQVCDNKYS